LCLKSQNNFVLLDDSKKAINVMIVSTENSQTEIQGIDFLRGIYGQGTIWKQCFYSGEKPNFPMIGVSTYDIQINCFIDPKPVGSFSYNINTCRWDTLR
jgi:hypothetical protein